MITRSSELLENKMTFFVKWWNKSLMSVRLLSRKLRPYIRGNILFVKLGLQMILGVWSSLSGLLRPAGDWNVSPWSSMSSSVRNNDWHHDHQDVTMSHSVLDWEIKLDLIIISPGYCSNTGLPIYISFKFIATITEDVFWWMRFLARQKHQLAVCKL